MALTRLNNQALTSITAAGLPSGTVLQVQRLQYTGTNTTSVASGSNQTLDHLQVNITPIATNSIIRLDAMVNGEWGISSAVYNSTWFFYRGGTKLSHAVAGSRNVGILMSTSLSIEGSDAGSTPETAYYTYFDTPSTTSQILYQVATFQTSGSTTNWYTNRTVTDTSNDAQMERGISFISATEIAG